MDDINIVKNTELGRYELYVGDELASLADYRPSGDAVVFHHTETRPPFEGRGLAERLVRFALDDVAARGESVVPVCWFVAEVIEANPQYAGLVAA